MSNNAGSADTYEAQRQVVQTPTAYEVKLDGWHLGTCPECGRVGLTDGASYKHAGTAIVQCSKSEAAR